MRRQGLTPTKIAKIAGFPALRTIELWKAEEPEFAEAFKGAWDEYASEAAEEAMEIANNLDKIPKLGARGKLQARIKQIHTRLRVASSRKSDVWGPNAISGGETVVLDVGMGIVKTSDLPGSPKGQNPAALEAMRKVKEK